MRSLEIGALLLALLVIVGLPAAAFGYQDLLRPRPDREFTLVGSGGRWSQEELRVRQGERVRLRVTSADNLHGFRLEGYDIESDEIYPGKVKEFEFVANEVGAFPFYCTVICAPDHGKMGGMLVVEP
jgi:cytochrome c oxidase subunit 2